MIIDRREIKLRYYDNTNIVKEYEIIPLDVEIMNGNLYLFAVRQDSVEFQTEYFSIERIESFTPSGIVSGEKWNRLESLWKRHPIDSRNSKSKIVIECKKDFVENLRRHYTTSLQYEEHNGIPTVTIEDNDSSFVEWIILQDTQKYSIVEPEHIKEKICTIAEALYTKYRKEQ